MSTAFLAEGESLRILASNVIAAVVGAVPVVGRDCKNNPLTLRLCRNPPAKVLGGSVIEVASAPVMLAAVIPVTAASTCATVLNVLPSPTRIPVANWSAVGVVLKSMVTMPLAPKEICACAPVIHEQRAAARTSDLKELPRICF